MPEIPQLSPADAKTVATVEEWIATPTLAEWLSCCDNGDSANRIAVHYRTTLFGSPFVRLTVCGEAGRDSNLAVLTMTGYATQEKWHPDRVGIPQLIVFPTSGSGAILTLPMQCGRGTGCT